jgi:hypothetical protein
MSDDEDGTVACQLVCCGDRLIRVAEIVDHNQLDPLAEHAAGGIEILDRESGAALELPAEPRLRARHRARHPNQDLRPSGPAERGGEDDHGG